MPFTIIHRARDSLSFLHSQSESSQLSAEHSGTSFKNRVTHVPTEVSLQYRLNPTGIPIHAPRLKVAMRIKYLAKRCKCRIAGSTPGPHDWKTHALLIVPEHPHQEF